MLKVDEFDHIHAVPRVLQHRGTDGVRQQRGEALLQQSVGKQQIKIAALLNLRVHFMLAAGHGENILYAPFHRIVQRIVRRGVAGVERDDHVDMLAVERVARDVGDNKAQILIAVSRRNVVAAPDHVFLQVVADDLRLHAALDGEVIVEQKRQIRLAAAEVKDRDLLTLRRLKRIVHQLDKAVDLLVLVVLAAHDPEIRGEYAKVDQRGDAFPLRENIFFFAVVRRGRRLADGLPFGGALVCPVVFADVLSCFRLGTQHDLAVLSRQVVFIHFAQLSPGDVAVAHLRAVLILDLEKRLAFERQRTNRRLRAGGGCDRCGKHKPGQRIEPLGQIG